MSVNGSEIEQQQLEQDAQSVSVTVEKQPFMSFAVALVALIVGLVLTNKKKGY